MADYSLSEAFQEIEEQLILSMIRNMQGHRDWELAEGFNWSMWQAEQLQALQVFREQNESLFATYFSTINELVAQALQSAYADGEMEQEIELLEAVQNGFSAPHSSSGTTGEFFKTNDGKLNALIKSTTKDFKSAQKAMLRTVNDEYRKIIFNAQVYANTGASTINQAIDQATHDFTSRGINCIEYKNGARVNISSYSEMALRTANKRAYTSGTGAKRDEWGVRLVIVNSRSGGCPICLKYNGKVFIDDVWSKGSKSDGRYPLLSKAIDNGFLHPNCKDGVSTYYEGITTDPPPLTKEEKAEAIRVYNLEQNQRYNERQIRKYKMLEQSSLDSNNKVRYKALRENWQKRQREFIKTNSDVLRRKYDREKVRVFPAPPDLGGDAQGL